VIRCEIFWRFSSGGSSPPQPKLDPLGRLFEGLMGWVLFALGLLAIPLIARLGMWLLRHASQVTPTEISTPSELQEILRALLSAGNDQEVLFIVWFPSRFEVRVTKRSRTSKPSTLDLEVRNSDMNTDLYPQAKASLCAEGLEFTEDISSAHQEPTGLRLIWPDGGPFVVSAAANAIAVLQSALPSDPQGRRAAACQSPSLWRMTGSDSATE